MPVRRSLLTASITLLAASVSHAGLLLHWKLDEPDGDYTSPPGYLEEVNGTADNSLEVTTGAAIVEGETGLVPDGGTCILLANTDPASYIDAGTVQSDGTYVAGVGDGTFLTLSEAYTVVACAKYSGTGEQVIISSDWNSKNGWMLGFDQGGIFFDFGTVRKSTGMNTVQADTAYMIAVRLDSTLAVFGGGVNDYSISFWDGAGWTHSDGTVDRDIRLQGLEIGAYHGTREMIGEIDDVRIYDHTLTQAELDELVGIVTPLALGPVAVPRTQYNEAEVECAVNLPTDQLTVYWGTGDAGETTTGWTGTPIPLGAQGSGSVAAVLSGLSEDTTYFFRYHGVITSPAEEAWSPAGTFTTPRQDPLPRLGIPAMTATYDDGADVECLLLDAGASSTMVVWDTTDHGTPAKPPGDWSNAVALGTAVENDLLAHSITGADGDTTHVVRFYAKNAIGSAWSEAGTFDTGLGTEAPPAGLTVDLVTGISVPLSWIDSYATETSFVIERASDAGFTLNVRTFAAPANATSYLDESGLAYTTYYYRVAAANAGGQTPFSGAVTATTGAAPPAVPILHWKLDDAGPNFTEEVSGSIGIAVAVNGVTTLQSSLAPDGGYSILLTKDDPPSYIDAGTLQADNTYVAGLGDGTFRTLEDAYTITAWANYGGLTSNDRVIISARSDPGSGWMLGFSDGGIFMDFGSTRISTGPATVSTDTTYLVSVRFDASRTIFGGGINDYSISFWDGTAWTHSDGVVNRGIRFQGLEIGSHNTGTRQLEGTLDDIRIYDGALTQAELNGLAEIAPPAGLVLEVAHNPSTDELTFTWNGEGGKTYDLLANPDLLTPPSSWGAVLSGVTSPQILARPPADHAFYAVAEAP